MFRGAYDSDFYRSVRDLLHDQVTLQQSKGNDLPEHYHQASVALDVRWDALIASEQAHRSDRATPSAASQAQPIRHVATAQNR
jgi:anaerobic magnesium-protoporphyrin IX monomethyl ester cyclase